VKTLPDINKQFIDWYQEVIFQAELVDHAPVKGSMIVRPYGTAIWESIVKVLDKKIKDTGHQNCLFPLLIPLSFIQKEAKHVEGFAPELAIVTKAGGKDLEEPYVIRPTSETIIHYSFARWIKSWRDLPLKINQWANVMRWEMRTRPFIRTTEFYWQEGHTAHATLEEAEQEVERMLNEYVDLVENYLAIPVFAEEKPASERFAGAERTFTIEGLMPDGKALQMGTSHLLSQSFAKAFEMQFQNKEGVLEHPYLTSWGMTTRVVGAMVMMHGDQKGLIIPPKIAPTQVVIIPIFRKGSDENALREFCVKIHEQLKPHVTVQLDDDQHESAGAKFYRAELRGIPLRVEVGPREMEAGQVVVVDRLTLQKRTVSVAHISQEVLEALNKLQNDLFQRAKQKRDSLIRPGKKLAEFGAELEEGGYAYVTGWCQQESCEKLLKDRKATIRCTLESKSQSECFACNRPSICDVLVAKAY
jgi:prolyl-tRNA synthetase